jgi:hypothetical protein
LFKALGASHSFTFFPDRPNLFMDSQMQTHNGILIFLGPLVLAAPVCQDANQGGAPGRRPRYACFKQDDFQGQFSLNEEQPKDTGVFQRANYRLCAADVGRSCVLVTVNGRNIMFDCGMHMGYNDERRFPDFSYISQVCSE